MKTSHRRGFLCAVSGVTILDIVIYHVAGRWGLLTSLGIVLLIVGYLELSE
jgi:hypothetical protein